MIALMPPLESDFSREIAKLGRELDLTSMGPRPRDWDRIRTLQNLLSTISSTAREQEGENAEDRMLAVLSDIPHSADDLRTLANRRLRRLADMKADVRLALGARMTWAIAEIVQHDEGVRALKALATKGLARRHGLILHTWTRVRAN